MRKLWEKSGALRKLWKTSSVDILVALLTYVGIFPTTDTNTPRWLRTLRFIYPRAAFLNMFYVMIVVHGSDIYYSWGNVIAVTEGTIHVFANLMAAVKTGAFLFQAHAVAQILEALHRLNGSDHADNEGEAQITRKTERISHRLVLYVPVVLTALATFASTMQMVGGITTRKFLFRVRIPYDVNATPLFELTLVHLSFSMVSSINIMGVTDTFIIFTLIQTLGRLKVLRHKMEHVHEYARKRLKASEDQDVGLSDVCGKPEKISQMNRRFPRDMHVFDNSLVRKCSYVDLNKIKLSSIGCECKEHRKGKSFRMAAKMDVEMERVLKECVKIHVEITRFVRQWEVLFSPVFAVQLACNLVPTGLLAIYLSLLAPLQLNEKEQALSQMLVGCILQLYIFCFLAKEITDEDSKIKDSLFKCNWLGASKKFKNSMQILISRANVPVVVHALRFIPMSMQVFMTVSQNAYSYYVALLIYIKKHQVV